MNESPEISGGSVPCTHPRSQGQLRADGRRDTRTEGKTHDAARNCNGRWFGNPLLAGQPARLPKQLLPLGGERTLLEDTVARLEGLVPPERTLVVTSERLEKAVREQLPTVPVDSIVGEPCKRNTAPCVALAALLVSRNEPRGHHGGDALRPCDSA